MGMGAVSPGRAVGCGADPAVLRAPYDRKYPSLGSLAAEGAHLVVPGVLGSVQAVVRLVGERGTPGDGQARGEGGERGSAEYGLVAARERWGSRRRDRPVSGREGGEGDGSGPSLPGPKTSGAPAHLQAPDEEDAPSTAAVEAKRAPACGNRGGRISLFRRASGTAGPELGPSAGTAAFFHIFAVCNCAHLAELLLGGRGELQELRDPSAKHLVASTRNTATPGAPTGGKVRGGGGQQGSAPGDRQGGQASAVTPSPSSPQASTSFLTPRSPLPGHPHPLEASRPPSTLFGRPMTSNARQHDPRSRG